MKNIKQFQNTVCQDEKLNAHINKLIKTTEANNDTISVFFSGVLSSFISGLLALLLDEEFKYPWIRIVSVIAVFIGVWVFLAKVGVPKYKKWAEKRRYTNIENLSKQEVVTTFNSLVTLSAIEINDALLVMEDKNQNESCREINEVIIVSEYIKCVNYVICNVNKKHIRTNREQEKKQVGDFINQYQLSLVYRLLYNSGLRLTNVTSELPIDCEDKAMLQYDLGAAIESFRKHRNEFGIPSLIFENRKELAENKPEGNE